MRTATQGLALLTATIAVLEACAPMQTTAVSANELSDSEQAQGWRLLFDGRTTTGWRGFRSDRIPDGWQVVDGALALVVAGPGDIITSEQFRNFELSLEWKVTAGGNSGIFWRATEEPELIWHVAPEMQVLDDARHPDAQSELTSAGALYALYPTRRGVVREAGEWNEARVVLNGNRGEHWLNGVKLFDFEIGSPDWEGRVRASKFATLSGFGRAPQGHIGLQAHGGPSDLVQYRNIKIRVLP